MPVNKKPMELHPLTNRSGFTTFFKNLRHGKPPTLVGNPPVTGHLYYPATKRKVTMRIKAILDIANEIKIGVTGDTDARTDYNDYRRTWAYISRVYKTSSKENAKKIEVELIKKFKESHPGQVVNKSVSRASRLTTYDGFFYIYIVFNVNQRSLQGTFERPKDFKTFRLTPGLLNIRRTSKRSAQHPDI